jgi:hypothetical protein
MHRGRRIRWTPVPSAAVRRGRAGTRWRGCLLIEHLLISVVRFSIQELCDDIGHFLRLREQIEDWKISSSAASAPQVVQHAVDGADFHLVVKDRLDGGTVREQL